MSGSYLCCILFDYNILMNNFIFNYQSEFQIQPTLYLKFKKEYKNGRIRFKQARFFG